jgi:serine protease Do
MKGSVRWTLWPASLLCALGLVGNVSAGPQAATTAQAGSQDSQKDSGKGDTGGQAITLTAPLAQLNLDGGYMGVYLEEVTPDRKRELGLSEERGAIVMKVLKGSPADKAGLKENDVVVSFNGRRVDSVMELQRLFRETPPGRSVTMDVIRGGGSSTVTATMGKHNFEDIRDWSGPKDLVPPGAGSWPLSREFGALTENETPFGHPRIGVSVEPLTDQLATFFGVKEGGGVLISEVAEDTPAARAGLRAGDVILSVGNVEVNAVADLRAEFAKNTGGPIAIKVIRDHREMTLTVKIEKKTRAGLLQGQRIGWLVSDFDREM